MLSKVKVRVCAVRELDMNRVPAEGEAEADWARGQSVEEEGEEESSINNNNGGTQPRKKLRLSKDQSRLLEESFRLNHTLNPVSKIRSKYHLYFLVFFPGNT